ncbi:MAG: glycosyltransferase family 1 protein [Opitutaceae bacterium]
MKVLLVGNLAEDRQESMRRYTDLLASGLKRRGHDVETLAPTLQFARLIQPYRYSGIPKYLGYVDKFGLFPRKLRRSVEQRRPDVVHITDHANAVYLPATRRAPTLVTCHDLLQVRAARGEIPQQRVGRFGRSYQAWILRNLARAPRVACVSSKTQVDVVRLTGLAPNRISVVPNALNYPFAQLSPAVARERISALSTGSGIDPARVTANPGGFLLNVGADHWYKNRPGLLSIYAELRRHLSPLPLLVLVGTPLSGADLEQAKALGLLEHIISFAAVSSEQLEAFYNLAEGLVFPSWEEGFGWPIAEAQACGCSVFTSNRPPLTEVGGRSATYFDPANPVESAQTIAASWTTRGAKRTAGLQEAGRWNPDAMLAAYEKIYRELVDERIGAGVI